MLLPAHPAPDLHVAWSCTPCWRLDFQAPPRFPDDSLKSVPFESVNILLNRTILEVVGEKRKIVASQNPDFLLKLLGQKSDALALVLTSASWPCPLSDPDRHCAPPLRATTLRAGASRGAGVPQIAPSPKH